MSYRSEFAAFEGIDKIQLASPWHDEKAALDGAGIGVDIAPRPYTDELQLSAGGVSVRGSIVSVGRSGEKLYLVNGDVHQGVALPDSAHRVNDWQVVESPDFEAVAGQCQIRLGGDEPRLESVDFGDMTRISVRGVKIGLFWGVSPEEKGVKTQNVRLTDLTVGSLALHLDRDSKVDLRDVAVGSGGIFSHDATHGIERTTGFALILASVACDRSCMYQNM